MQRKGWSTSSGELAVSVVALPTTLFTPAWMTLPL